MANRMTWTWTVVDDPKTVNAWMVPGGRAAVYTGMIDFAKSDDELAVVMGHEASHAIARHGTERASTGALFNLGTNVVGAVTGSGAVRYTPSGIWTSAHDRQSLSWWPDPARLSP